MNYKLVLDRKLGDNKEEDIVANVVGTFKNSMFKLMYANKMGDLNQFFVYILDSRLMERRREITFWWYK